MRGRIGIVSALTLALVVAFPALTWATAAHKAVTCGATVTSVVVENSNRNILILFNNETTDAIAVGAGVPSALTAANGLLIQAKGALTLDGYSGEISCIRTGAADSNLRVLEVMR